MQLGDPPGVYLEIDVEGFEGLRLQHDPSPASWVSESLWVPDSFGTVAALVPPVFKTYARVAYPPRGPDGRLEASALLDVLGHHTTTASDVWFCLWEGYGGLPDALRREELVHAPPERPMRSYRLFRGALSAWEATTRPPLFQAADLFWPEDRAWFLGTDTDIDDAFIGGSEECIASLGRSVGAVRTDPGGSIAPESEG